MAGELALQSPGGGQVASLEDFILDADRLLYRKAILNRVMLAVMRDGEHYGVIPGCGKKPSLLKPGAEAIASTFQLCPRYQINKTELGGGHREYELMCELYNPAGGFVGSGVGSATTMEGKYRFRKADQTCPECGKAVTIIRGKKEYGGGWVCFPKKGGCGAKFKDGDPAIESQNMGRVDHDNPADYYNTVLKMAKKRAFVDAVLTATGASDIFTQDIEDMPEVIPAQNSASKPAAPAVQPPPAGERPTVAASTLRAIKDAATQAGISHDDLLADMRNRFGDDTLQDAGQLWDDEGQMLLRAIKSRQVGKPTAVQQMDEMPT